MISVKSAVSGKPSTLSALITLITHLLHHYRRSLMLRMSAICVVEAGTKCGKGVPEITGGIIGLLLGRSMRSIYRGWTCVISVKSAVS